MPHKPLRPCSHPGCGALTASGYCPAHIPKRPDRRASASARGYGHRWQKESKRFLAAHPWCAECRRQGRATPAKEVDHIKPHRGDRRLFWDRTNWQPLCHSCHSTKTAREDGGFGNKSGTTPHP